MLFMSPKELWEAYSNGTVCLSVRLALCLVHISYIFLGRYSKFGVCGCILGWRSVSYHFQITVTLTFISDLAFFNNHVRSISLILFEIGIPNLVCGCILG